MQGSKTANFIKAPKRSKGFDDGYNGRQNNKKNDYHRLQREKAKREQQEQQ
jgi:hypothetical protein